MKYFDTKDILTLCLGIFVSTALLIYLEIAGFDALVFAYQKESLVAYFASLVFMVGGYLLYLLYKHRPDSPIAYLREDFLTAERRRHFVRALVYSIVLSVFGTFFSLSKRMIPIVTDYTWDPTWIAWDIAIHGQHAWLFMQPLLGFPFVTWALSGAYHAWVLLIFFGNFYFSFFERDVNLRCQYIASYILCWSLLGILMATAFASVGPCFIGPILDMNTFDSQMAYLKAVNEQLPMPTLRVQDRLLGMYHDETAILGAGISAMPSMHVSHAFLVFFAMLRKPKWIAAFFGIFALLVMIGSVHLGYHYAVDGYVAIVLTALIWVVTGKILRWSERTRPATGNAYAT